MQPIDRYTDENAVWEVAPDIINSPGNLCLHLIEHLNYHLGQIDYHRRLLTNGQATPYSN